MFVIFNDDGDIMRSGFETEEDAELTLSEEKNVGLLTSDCYVDEVE